MPSLPRFNGLSLNPPPQSNLTEGILDIGKAFEKERPERPVIVVVAVSGGQAGGASSNEVLDQLRQSGATMHAVTISSNQAGDPGSAGLADASNREQVLGDGAKQSGGRRIEVTATIAVTKGLQQIAADLSAQYTAAVHAARRRQARSAAERQPEARRRDAACTITHPGSVALSAAACRNSQQIQDCVRNEPFSRRASA